jgi:Flp pilus assembly protein TadG
MKATAGARARRGRAARERGQALVEFSLALIPFLMLLMAVFDFGRAIYMYNGLSQAAREVARAASVEEESGTGYGVEAQATIATQQALVPGLTVEDPFCVLNTEADDSSATPKPCAENEYLVVTTRATYTPVSLLGFLGTIDLEARSRMPMPLSQNR